MDPTTSLGLAALVSFLTTLPAHVIYHVVGGEAHDKYRQLVERLGGRLLAGGLPPNAHLEEAVRSALSGAALVFAYTFHDPERRLLRELIRERSWRDLKQFAHQLAELVRRNIIQETPNDRWIGALIARARRPESFADFNIDPVLSGGRSTAVIGHALDEALRDHVHAEFLRWIPAGYTALSPTPYKPTGFDESVRNGLEIRPGQKLTLYDLFCLFFREELKEGTDVHRAFVIDVLAGLTADVEALAAGLPSRTERQQLEAAVGALTSFEEYARGLKQQNHELVEELRGVVERLERRLEHAIAGLPIQRFQLPDPPQHEIELLQAKHRAVTLLGRDPDLDALWHWLLGSEPVSARLIIGGAGSGKTRLAFELLLRVDDRLPHWQAGLLTGRVLQRFDATKQPMDWSWPAPTLLVVDYAQTLLGPLGELLRALTHKRRVEGLEPLRILLLERQAGDWFDSLLREEDSGGPCPVRKLFDPPEPVSLTPLPRGELRRRLFESGLVRASELTGTPAPRLPEDDGDYQQSLGRDLFAEPLNLILAALAATDLGLLPALRRERIDLAIEMARKQARRMKRFARAPGNEAQERLLCHLAACATVERGFHVDELERAVHDELTALRLEWPDGEGDLARVLRLALPHERLAVAPIEPDFVGEAFVLEVLARPDTPAGPARLRSWSAVVERCACRNPRATPSTVLHAFQSLVRGKTLATRFSRPRTA